MSFLDPPNWRWLHAVDLIDEQSRPSRRDDEIIVRAFKFLRRKRAANKARMKVLRTDYPDLFAANRIYEEEDQDRWMMEASICTDAPYERIASDNAIEDVRIVRAYAELFFDVRSYLVSPMYVHKYIIKPALRNRTLEEASPDFVQKLIALTLGYGALLNSWRFGYESPEQVKLAMTAQNNQMQKLGIEAAFVTPVNRYTSLELIEKAAVLNEQIITQGEGTQSAAVEAVRAIIRSVKFRRRTVEDAKKLGPEGLEPRALENVNPDGLPPE